MKNIIISVIVFLISLTLGFAIQISTQNTFMLGGVFIVLTLVVFTIQWLAYIPAVILKTEKFYDLTGSLTYLICILVSLVYLSEFNQRSVIITAIVSLWALRLGSFLFIRIAKDGKDRRFDEIKVNPSRFFVTWNLQGLWVCVTSCAAWAGITLSYNKPELSIIGWLGLALWCIGFTIEVIADWQKSQFKADKGNQGKFIQSGLWSICRHPNYLGEIVLWTGVFTISSEVLFGSTWATAISPFFVYFLLTKISGVPLLTKQAKKKWGDDSHWQDYFENTPAILPYKLPQKRSHLK